MKTISHLWDEVWIITENEPTHRGNEAELTKAIIQYRTNGIISEKSVLLRECILWDKATHNAEIRHIYDRLRSINDTYEQSGKKYRVNVVKHFTDEKGDIYIKDLNPTGEIYAYDLLPDGYYLDDDRKMKSRFGEFKKMIHEFNLDSPEIVKSVFEQLAILHANNFVVGTIVRWEREMNHPTLSLFLCRLKNKRQETGTKVFVHDIHNLVEYTPPSLGEYTQSCLRDLKDLSFDIIRYFKWIGLPHYWFRVYGDVLRELNPDLYSEVYRTFLWNPGMEIETMAMSQLLSERKKERDESKKVVARIEKEVSKGADIKKLFGSDNIFMFGSKKEKIRQFLSEVSKENTEFIFDFDGTLTAPNGQNAYHAAVQEDGAFNVSENISDGFVLRRGAIAFLRMIIASGFDVKIHSFGFGEVIYEVLKNHGLDFPKEKIFANNPEKPASSKRDIPIELNPEKSQIILGDNTVDFDLAIPKDSLKIGFLSSKKQIEIGGATDFYHLENCGDYIYLYHLFRKFFKE